MWVSPDALRAMLFEQSPEAMVVYDRAMRIVECNDALARCFGTTRNHILGLHINDLRDRRFQTSLERALAGEVVRYEASYHATSSDTWFWGAVTFAPLRDAQGTVVAALGIVDDCTLDTTAAAAIGDSEQRLNEAQRLGRVGSWSWDIVRGAFHSSAEFHRILGALPDEMPHLADFERFVHGDDCAKVREHFEKQLAGGTPFTTCEFRLSPNDGHTRWVIVRAEMRYDHDDRPAFVWGTVQDVTERHELEEQLRRAQRMETLGQLAAGVAHDFNNLLTVICVEAELVQQGLVASDALHAEVNEIQKAATRAASLTRQLLAFSRRQILRPRVIDLNELVSETSTMLRRLIGEDIELVSELAPDLPLIVADPGQLQQVLLNLAVNARDAMSSGGVLRVSTSSAVIGERDPLLAAGSYSVLTVADTGHGIDAGVKHRIFDPFFTTKPPGKGTGLGLSTVIGIVEQTGGKIFVSSEAGRGAMFTIYLPCAENATLAELGSAVPAARNVNRTRPQATLLLVEDERALRNIAQRTLEAAGYTVLAAEDGFGAIAASETFNGAIDLLVADLVLPGLNGCEIAARLALRRPEMQVLYVSGYTDEDIGRRDLLERGVPLLEKPFSATMLVEAVGELVKPQLRQRTAHV